MKKLLRHVKDSIFFAYAQGCVEALRFGGSAGRTHATKQSWNEAYDSGMNLAARIRE